MPWITPRTWTPDLIVTSTHMNEISTSLDYLLKPNRGVYTNGAGTTTGATTSWAAVPGFSFTMTCYGAPVLFGFQTFIEHSDAGATNTSYLGVMVDGVYTQALWAYKTSWERMASGSYLISNVAAGSRTFALAWRVSHAYTITLTNTNPVSFIWGIEL